MNIALGPCDHDPLCGPPLPMDDGTTSCVSHPILCGVCPDDNAYVLASMGGAQWYGLCSICSHTVFLGKYGSAWVIGPDLSEVLAKEVRS